MTTDIVQYAAISGELAENLWGRTDFQKYDTGWAKAQNWLVDYRGGLTSRFGFEFGDIVEWNEGEAVKLIPFQYSPDTANTYIAVFTDDKVRFVQDNAYVLEGDVTVTSLANSTGDRLQVTAPAHGFSDGDWVKLSGFTTNTALNTRTVQVTNKATNTFECLDPITWDYVEVASVSSETGTVNRIYTITSPYGQEDFERLQFKQVRDYVRLTHPDYPVKNLIRNNTTNWEIATEEFGVSVARPASASYTTSWALGYLFIYAITAIDKDGNEGLPRLLMVTSGADIMTANGRYNNISWSAVSGAVSYRIYRSRQLLGGTTTFSDTSVGYIGRSITTKFSDTGVTPDFSDTYPINRNPFANGTIQYVTTTANGSGYAFTSSITFPSGGTGGVAELITDFSGSSGIYGLILLDGGKDYTSTSFSFGTGTGATVTATLSETSGNNPHCCALFQQRLLYAATDNNPLRVYGSRAGLLSNFTVSDLGKDDDSYEFDLDASTVAPIRHLTPVSGGVFVLSQIGVWLLYGRQNGVLTPSNAQADPQTDVGSAYVQPVLVDSVVVYVSEAGQHLRILSYVDEQQKHLSQNVSLLSNHLFDAENDIESLAYAMEPFKLVMATQRNGQAVAFTIDQQNAVWGMTPFSTQGKFRYVTSVLEDNSNRIYCAVERNVNGNRVMYIERSAKRAFTTHEDAFCVDAGLALGKTFPEGRLCPSSMTGAVTFTVVGATPFSAGDVGKVLRCANGKATITGYTSSSILTGTWTRDLDKYFPETDDPAEFDSGSWTLDTATSTISGLWHLEGEAVDVLMDGEVITGKTVANGTISLSTAASRGVVGKGFRCIARPLPLTTADLPIESRVKNVPGIAVRLHKSAGLKVGNKLTKLYPIHNRSVNFGWTTADASALRDEVVYQNIRQDWKRDNEIYLVVNTPQPATLTLFVRDTELGDDKE